MKTITLRKISTGGLLIIAGKSASAIIKAKGLDPTDWEEVAPAPMEEVDNLDSTQGNGREEDN